MVLMTVTFSYDWMESSDGEEEGETQRAKLERGGVVKHKAKNRGGWSHKQTGLHLTKPIMGYTVLYNW